MSRRRIYSAWGDRYDAILVSLIQAGPQFIELSDLRITGQRIIFDALPFIAVPRACIFSQIIAKTSHPFRSNLRKQDSLVQLVFHQMFEARFPITPIPGTLCTSRGSNRKEHCRKIFSLASVHTVISGIIRIFPVVRDACEHPVRRSQQPPRHISIRLYCKIVSTPVLKRSVMAELSSSV